MRPSLVVLLWVLLIGPVAAEPGARWSVADATAAPWGEAAARAVEAYAAARHPTAVMVVQGDRVIVSSGDVGRPVTVNSVRKSLLGALYGLAVAERRIALGDTLEQLGIDDVAPALTSDEKRATVEDLLTARSGVYHPAAYETSAMRKERPARGSHAAGTFWFYNNWDFNVLGTIYRKATGDDIFDAFARRIAGPIGMEDFSARDGRYVQESASQHPAYLFRMSARDLARFGLLYLQGGRWNGAQVVPADWVAASVTARSVTARGGFGYGRLWWTLPEAKFGPGAFLASGNGGQFIAVVPSRRLVVVETVEARRGAEGIRTRVFLDLVGTLVSAANG